MKKIMFVSVLILCAFLTEAQTQKGNWMVGGTFGGLNFSSTGDNRVFSLGVTPVVAKFVADNIAVGGGIDIKYVKPKDANGSFNFGITPIGRYYFSRNGANGFFGQAKVGLGVTSYDDNNPATDNTSTTLIGGLGVGYNRFITDNVALEAGLGYTLYNPTRSGVKPTHDVGLNVGLQIFLPQGSAKRLMNRDTD